MRVAKTAFEITKPFDKKFAELFLNKALSEFEKNLPEETLLKKELVGFQAQIDLVHNDPLKRLRWGEKIMTIATRLGSM